MRKISDSTVRRLSLYLRSLDECRGRGVLTVSSERLARESGTTPAQVRKDLSFFGSFGKRGLGYSVPGLARRIRRILGLGREWRVLVVGAGRIGTALAGYGGFGSDGFRVVALADTDRAKVGGECGGIPVWSALDLERVVREAAIEIAIVATPAAAAQEVVDRLVAAGVRAILNFAPVKLEVPGEVVVKTVNMALELEGLSYALVNGSRSG
jgi:redox-sensing transcriptional repressor